MRWHGCMHGCSKMSDVSVFVNLTWLVPGRVGGSEESTTDALRAVLNHCNDIRLTFAVLKAFAKAHPDLSMAVPTDVLELSGSSRIHRVWADQTWLAGRTRFRKPDVVHHGGGVVPLVHPGRSTLTIHDIQPLDMPENFTLAKRLYLKSMLGRSARAASLVCTPSEFSRGRVIDEFGLPPEKVEVVPWCVRVAESEGGDPAEPLPGGVDGRYLLYPAMTHPHKNHLFLIDAFAEVLKSHPDLKLVLPGGPGLSEGQVRERIRQRDVADSVVRLGRLDHAEIDRLYAHAIGVLVPSTYEGFGLPALEAMKRSVPLLVSGAGSLPEVASGEGMHATIDPTDTSAWIAAITELVEMSPQGRSRLAAAGAASAARFSELRTAKGLATLWRRAASEPAKREPVEPGPAEPGPAEPEPAEPEPPQT